MLGGLHLPQKSMPGINVGNCGRFSARVWSKGSTRTTIQTGFPHFRRGNQHRSRPRMSWVKCSLKLPIAAGFHLLNFKFPLRSGHPHRDVGAVKAALVLGLIVALRTGYMPGLLVAGRSVKLAGHEWGRVIRSWSDCWASRKFTAYSAFSIPSWSMNLSPLSP